MGSSGRVDQATIAFRRVLAEANVGEQARVDALVVLSQRTVYAATWPGQNQAARTLTNSEGESALPLFTGLDVLDTTATRFGWRNPDGSLQFRELGAREALRHALARGVNFVVVDIGCEHSVEFAREELEPLMQLQTLRNGTGPFAASGERHAAILEAVRRSSSRPPRSSGLPANTQSAVASAFAEGRAGREASAEPFPREPREPPASARETQPSPPMAAAVARRRPSSQNLQAAAPSAALTQMAGAATGTSSTRISSNPPSSSMKQPPTGNAAKPSGDPASASMKQPTGANPVPGTNPALKQTGANPVVRPQTGANPVLKQTGANAVQKQTGPNTIVKQATLSAEPTTDGAPSASLAGAARQPGAAQGFANREPGTGGLKKPRDDEPTIADRGNEKALSAPKVALSDELLRGISGGLRAFPEVEWACVLSDGSEIPLIGLRVDPSFLNRVADITDAVIDEGEKHAAELQVMLLNNQDLVKSARRCGKTFYPWRR